jgi:GNAT superfamily N-acetyltransferase
MIELVPIQDKEHISAFIELTMSQYTFDLMHSLHLGEEEAERKSKRDLGPMLEGKFDPAGHYFCHSRSLESGEIVGGNWMVVESEIRTAWIYYILIYEPFRRRGFGIATINALHGRARELGCDQASLYVYAHNPNAQALYNKVGYHSSAQFMRLEL